MTQLTDTRRKNHTFQRWSAAVLLASLIVLTWVPWHSTAKLESTPVTPQHLRSFAQTQRPKVGLRQSESHAPTAPTSAFTPFLNIVPSQDGRELYISAGGVGELGGTVFANIGIGPGHDKHSYTMVYSDTVQAYVATAAGFTPNMDASGPMNITTTLGLDTGMVDFNRAYVLSSTIQTVGSIDGNLELTLVSTDTITFDTYIAIVPSYAPPGPAPLGHRFAGSSYSVRAAGALLVTDEPMSLRLYYNDTTLAGADPHTLAVFGWDAFNERWDDLGGRLFYDQQYVSVATSRFTTYALMSTPAWRDDFDDFNGLNFPAEVSNVTLRVQGDNRELVLLGTVISGIAVSKPVTPTTAIDSWGNLAFTGTMNPPTTTLSVDVLSVDGTEILTDVISGASLASIDPVQHPALKLRVYLFSTVVGETPSLDRWQVTWQVEEYKVYLPVALRRE
jgi:hypothetical protein